MKLYLYAFASDHSCSQVSLVSPQRGLGAGVGVGMLRGGGEFHLLNMNKSKVSKLLLLLLLGFFVSWFQSFKV